MDKYAEALGRVIICAAERAQWRFNLRKELSFGIRSLSNDPDNLFVYQVLAIHNNQHVEKVTYPINKCKGIIPEKVHVEEINHADGILKGNFVMSSSTWNFVQTFPFP